MELLDFLRIRMYDELHGAGMAKAKAEERALAFEDDVRATFGGDKRYIHGPDLKRRNKVIRNAWSCALSRNGALGSARLPQTVLRDQFCNDHGISRETLARILRRSHSFESTPEA